MALTLGSSRPGGSMAAHTEGVKCTPLAASRVLCPSTEAVTTSASASSDSSADGVDGAEVC